MDNILPLNLLLASWIFLLDCRAHETFSHVMRGVYCALGTVL